MTTRSETVILAREHFRSDRFRERLTDGLAAVSLALSTARAPYIAFSSGKDSLATMALVQAVGGDVPLAWSDDELEYPESVEYMALIQRLAGRELTITLGHTTHAGWFRPWENRPLWRDPLPGSIAIDRDQDDWMAAASHDLTFLGLRMRENRRRRDWLVQTGPIYGAKTGTGRRCCPLWDWSADDVWALIHGWRLPYNGVYDRLEAIQVPHHAQRVGPLPLARRQHLADGWPDLLARLEARYGRRWT